MSIRKIFFIGLIIFCSACASDTFLEHNGNMPDKEKVAQIHQGQSKEEVYDILGAPSLVTGLNDNHWIYMSSTVKKVAFLRPEEISRDILALSFKDDKIQKIEKKTLADAHNITIDKNVTEAADPEVGFFKKYFGGVGTYVPFSGNSGKGL